MRPNLAKFRQIGTILQVLGNFLTLYFLFGKMFSLLWQICDSFGLIFIVTNDQILKNNLTIWSHCRLLTFLNGGSLMISPWTLTAANNPLECKNFELFFHTNLRHTSKAQLIILFVWGRKEKEGEKM